MLIENANPESIETPIRSLLRPLTACPYKAAPERETELKVLAEKHKLRLTLDSTKVEFTVFVSRILNTVWIGLPTLERLWAYAYGYFTLFEIEREVGQGVEVDLCLHPEGMKARTLLLWALTGEHTGKLLPWPKDAPTPDSTDDRNVQPANEIFLMMCAWIFLHELAHLELGHTEEAATKSEESIKHEFEADAWACHWLLDRWQDYKIDERVFINRTLGITFGIATLTGIEFYREAPERRTHPIVPERLLAFLDEFIPERDREHAERKEIAWLAACAVISANIIHHPHYDPKIKHVTMRDYIIYSSHFFPKNNA